MAVGGIGGPGRTPPPLPPKRDRKVQKENLGPHEVSTENFGPSIEERKAQLGGSEKIPMPSTKEPGSSGDKKPGLLGRIWNGVKKIFRRPSSPTPREISSPRLPGYVEHGVRLPGLEGFRERIQRRETDVDFLEEVQEPDTEDKTTQKSSHPEDNVHQSKSRSTFYYDEHMNPIDQKDEDTSSVSSSSSLSKLQKAVEQTRDAMKRASGSMALAGEKFIGKVKTSLDSRTVSSTGYFIDDDFDPNQAVNNLSDSLTELNALAPEFLPREVSEGAQALMRELQEDVSSISSEEVNWGQVDDQYLSDCMNEGIKVENKIEDLLMDDDLIYAQIEWATKNDKRESPVELATGVEYAKLADLNSEAEKTSAEGTSSQSRADRIRMALRNLVRGIFEALAAFFRSLAMQLNRARHAAAEAVRRCFNPRRNEHLQPRYDDNEDASLRDDTISWLQSEGVVTEGMSGESIEMRPLGGDSGTNNNDTPFPRSALSEELVNFLADWNQRQAHAGNQDGKEGLAFEHIKLFKPKDDN